MNSLNKMEGSTSWLRSALFVVATLMPIWFAPIRTAPVETHLLVWAVIIAGSLLYCYGFMGPTNQTIRVFLMQLSGGAMGIIFGAWLFWNGGMVYLGNEGKLVSLYFVGAITLWFFVTHTRTDGSVKLM